MAQKRKAARGRSNGNGKTRRASTPKPRRRMQTPPPMREIPLDQGLRALGAEGARTLFSALLAFAVLAAIAGGAFLAWNLRPMPEYTSDAIQAGSPFDVTFHVRNASEWFTLARPVVACQLTYAGQPEGPPITATDVTFTPGEGSRFAPGETASFKCPLRATLPDNRADELTTALRSQLVFRLSYDLPFGLSRRMTEKSVPFVLDTKQLPPRWTEKR